MRVKLHKPTASQKSVIFAVLSGIGVVATGVLSARCAKKTSEDMKPVEKAKAYAPAIVSGGATIGCIALGTYISHEEIVALTAAGGALAQKFVNYRKSVEEVVTDEQREQINTAFYEKEIARLEEELAKRDHPTDEDDLATFVDAYSGYTFKERMEAVEAGIAEANRHWEDDQLLCWCDIFYLINGDTFPSESIIGGNSFYHYGVGWSRAMFDQLEIDPDHLFKVEVHEMKDHPNTYLIDYTIEPELGFEEY